MMYFWIGLGIGVAINLLIRFSVRKKEAYTNK